MSMGPRPTKKSAAAAAAAKRRKEAVAAAAAEAGDVESGGAALMTTNLAKERIKGGGAAWAASAPPPPPSKHPSNSGAGAGAAADGYDLLVPGSEEYSAAAADHAATRLRAARALLADLETGREIAPGFDAEELYDVLEPRITAKVRAYKSAARWGLGYGIHSTTPTVIMLSRRRRRRLHSTLFQRRLGLTNAYSDRVEHVYMPQISSASYVERMNECHV